MPKRKTNFYTNKGYKKECFFTKLLLNQKFLAIIGLGFLLLIVFPLAKTYSQKMMVEKEINDVKKQISEFNSQNKDLDEMIKYLQSDQSLEEQARLNLNMKEPGEEVIVINNDKAPEKTIEEKKKEEENKSSFQKWWDYFFN